jgi:hypothetical protein
MEGKLRTNVISKRYTFHVMYRDKYDEIITVEAESVDAAALKLPQDRFCTVLLSEEDCAD